MYVDIGTVTIRSFHKTRYNHETDERVDLKPDEYEYDIVAIDKFVGDFFELGKVVEGWHQRLPYHDFDVQFHSSAEW